MSARTSIPLTLVAFLALAMPLASYGQQTPAEIQQAINEHNSQISELNAEIAQYQSQLNQVATKKRTLQNTLTEIDLSIKKVTASIRVTQNQIAATQLEIQQLDKGIASKSASIAIDEAGLGESMRRLNEMETQSLISQILSADDISTIWQDIDSSRSLQGAVNEQIGKLAAEKQSLTDTKTTVEQKRAQLLKQKAQLATQQGSLNATRQAQSELLAQTKNQEATYQSIIAKKKAQEEALWAALSDLKAKFNVAVNPSEITPAGKGVLQWPVDNVRITQYFGNTPFARSGAYSGKGHNGMDFGIPIGTPIRASLSGIVVGTGNTDTVKGCYSFGKWVMVRHNNGISTMYAHLSSIGVTQGQSVATGQVLGYSGETGYATGPHLHFGVYVTASTQIMRLGDATQSTTACGRATMPITPLAGYLNPMNYLP